MDYNVIKKSIYQFGIVPVIALDDVSDATPLASALSKGGLEIAEVTFRTDSAYDVMVEMKKSNPNMIIGAGTVINKKQVDLAIKAGASFIVSPGLNPNIVKYCQEKNILIIPGCSNASDIELAIELGLDTVKFFPAEACGGLKTIKALSAPYRNVNFMPTGGINESNLLDYLSFDKIIACGGTWMIPNNLIKNKDFNQIELLTKSAVKKMLNIKLAHIGINSKNESNKIAQILKNFSGCDLDIRAKSIFAGDVELMIEPQYGKLGHIAYSTSNVDRAKYYLEKEGFSFYEESCTKDTNGKLTFIYSKEEVNGFALHLVKEK